jgi:aspartate racemase
VGGLHSAKLVMSSIDFAEMEELQHTNRWTEAGEMLAGQARGLKSAVRISC